MAEGIARGNKRVYNFSLDETADADLIKWLREDVKVVSTVARQALRDYKEGNSKGPKEGYSQPLNTQNGDQMTQLIQLVQASIQSNQQMFNTMLMMMQSQNQTQMPGVAPVQPVGISQDILLGLMSSLATQQQAVRAKEEQAVAVSNEEEPSDEVKVTEEQMLAAQELVDNSGDPMDSLDEWD